MITVPKVVFRGRLVDHQGRAAAEQCALLPRNPVGAVELQGMLVSTRAYYFTPSADGTFALHVLPTNVGVERPWHYELVTPLGVYRIQLPSTMPVHDLQKMLSQGSR